MVFVQDADGVSVRGPSNTEWSLALGSSGKLHNLKVLYLVLPYINGALALASRQDQVAEDARD